MAEQMHQLGIQGLSLAIAEGSRIVHTDTVAMPGGKAHAQQTPFSIGSLTKSLAVLVVMQLVAMGEAELDALAQRHRKISS